MVPQGLMVEASIPSMSLYLAGSLTALCEPSTSYASAQKDLAETDGGQARLHQWVLKGSKSPFHRRLDTQIWLESFSGQTCLTGTSTAVCPTHVPRMPSEASGPIGHSLDAGASLDAPGLFKSYELSVCLQLHCSGA